MSIIRRRSIGKRGSYTVFLAMFMAGMIVMSGAVINAAHKMAVDSSMEDLGRVWTHSIMGEYDKVLRDRYGLYGYYGNDEMVREKLILYSDYSFKTKKYIKRGEISCHTGKYKLTDLDTFSRQIDHIALSIWFPVPFGEGNATEDKDTEQNKGKEIRAGWIKGGLPSECYEGKGPQSGILSTISEASYIFKVFKDHVDDRKLGKTYFRNEVEYIISGKLSDEKAFRNVRDKLILERNGLNLTYLYTCPEKREAALQAAELITPGPEALITQAIILETWAFLEARNDVALLTDGERVPLIKGDDNWALSIDNAVESEFGKDKDGELDTREEKKYVRPKVIEGQNYEEYLKTLLLAVPEKKKLLRIMDLIQINMKYLYCGDFLMDDYRTGLEWQMEINGKEHCFYEKYK